MTNKYVITTSLIRFVLIYAKPQLTYSIERCLPTQVFEQCRASHFATVPNFSPLLQDEWHFEEVVFVQSL